MSELVHNFEITKKIKYGEEWNWPETKAWMGETKDTLLKEFANAKEDYKGYRNVDFATIEEFIIINIYGVTPEIAKRAYNESSILRSFGLAERQHVKRLRWKLGKIANKGKKEDTLQIQVIPIAMRMDGDLKKDDSVDQVEREKKEANKTTGRVFVFRLKGSDGAHRFVDCEGRVYRTWQAYLNNNKLPQCIICYPKDGFLRKKVGDTFVPNDVEFCEPKSCQWSNRTKAVCDKVAMFATPIVALGSLCCPATWPLATSIISAASTGFLCYSAAAQGVHLVDQYQHDENYGANLTTCVTTIATTLLGWGLNKYTRMVALEHRAFTAMESIAITGSLLGMNGMQLASFVWMTWSIATKPTLEPLDVIGYVMACHNLHSCIVSPKTAGQFLKKVKLEIQAENLQYIEKDKVKIQEENNKIAENKSKLAGTRGATKAKIEKKITSGQEIVAKLEDQIKNRQNGYLNNVEGWMTHNGAREELQNFRNESMENKGNNSIIDQNGRIINVVKNMDAEKIFTMMSKGQLKIQLPNGESVSIFDSLSSSFCSIFQSNNKAGTSQIEMEKSSTKASVVHIKEIVGTCASVGGSVLSILKILHEKSKEEPFKSFISNVKSRMKPEETSDPVPQTAPTDNPNNNANNPTPGPAGPTNPPGQNNGSNRRLELAHKMAEAYGDTSDVIVRDFVKIVTMEYEDFKNPEDPPRTREKVTDYHVLLTIWEIGGLVKDGKAWEDAETLAAENYQKRESVEDAKANGANGEEIARLTATIDNSLEKYHKQNFAAWNSLGTKEDVFFNEMLDPNNPDKFNEIMERIAKEIKKIQTLAENEGQPWPTPISAYIHTRKLQKSYANSNNSQEPLATAGAA